MNKKEVELLREAVRLEMYYILERFEPGPDGYYGSAQDELLLANKAWDKLVRVSDFQEGYEIRVDRKGIKQCRKCGGNAYIGRKLNGFWNVFCVDCGPEKGEIGEDQEATITAWNMVNSK